MAYDLITHFALNLLLAIIIYFDLQKTGGRVGGYGYKSWIPSVLIFGVIGSVLYWMARRFPNSEVRF